LTNKGFILFCYKDKRVKYFIFRAEECIIFMYTLEVSIKVIVKKGKEVVNR
jgi:hypothetical protein